jgi:sialate O-acetylesterase
MASTLLAGAAFALEPLSPIAPVMAHPLLSPIFADNMVLQRDQPNTFWGWTAPGRAVEIEIGGKHAETKADASGRWEIHLAPPKTGGPYELQLKNDGKLAVTLHNLLVGDVWLCGGQSNMVFGLKGAAHGDEEVRAAQQPNIRFFIVEQQVAYRGAAIPRGTWKVCTPETAGGKDGWSGISAVAYYFARRVRQDVDVPIGLVEACVGGTPVETWMRPKTLAAFPEFKKQTDELEKLTAADAPPYGNYVSHWYDRYDLGTKDPAWFTPAFDDSKWRSTTLARGFEDFGLADVPSVIWFRRTIDLPAEAIAGRVAIALGQVEKMETVWINGRWVGASSWVENPRHYTIPAGVLKPGKNEIAIRVFKLKSRSAFLDTPDHLKLELADGHALPLNEGWKAAVSVDARPPHELPLGYENYPIMPSVLYRGMIVPIAPLALKGALWYQGEANWTQPQLYAPLLRGLISDWRAEFESPELPFYIVSLPAFQKHHDPAPDGWSGVRAAQIEVGEHEKNSGVAITVDTGDPDNIHPTDKLPVGERLARVALAKTYHRNVPSEGPTFDRFDVVGGALRVHFRHAKGLNAKGGKAEEFAIAGADHKWHWADAKIEGETVVLSSKDVPAPLAATYAWQADPKATLYNSDGLPMVPFSTEAR